MGEAVWLAGVEILNPETFGNDDDAGPEAIVDATLQRDTASVVVDANELAGSDATAVGVIGVHVHGGLRLSLLETRQIGKSRVDAVRAMRKK